jgi:hypothetical protein
MSNKIEEYVEVHSKGYTTGFLLTLFFGPLGLLYTGWVAAIILCVTAIATAASVIGPVICWVLAIVISFSSVNSFNRKVRVTANLMSN